MIQLVKHLPCEDEDLSLSPRTQVKISGLVDVLTIPTLGGENRDRRRDP